MAAAVAATDRQRPGASGMSALHAFPGGLCLPANKERSTALPIQQAPLAQRYIVPLGQHI
ncbi:hypothetical protein, partial [Escherichia coli]|uniref:hypothetical protein n=1 Tax=Escherichia coli TaxID=562 RepID=UPI003D162D5A